MKMSIVVLVAALILPLYCAADDAKDARTQDIIAFEKWFHSQLPETYSSELLVQVKEDEHGNRGLYSTKDLESDDAIFSMPWHMMVTVEKILLDFPELAELLQPVKQNLGDDDVLAVFLVYLKQCKHQNTFWDPWLIPNKFDSILYFTDDEVKLLKGAPEDRAKWRRQEAAEKFAAFAQELFPQFPGECSEVTYDTWKWALSVVSSRRLHLFSEDNALPPYFDFFNHENPNIAGQEMWGYNPRRMLLHAEAMSSYKTGQQVSISYGQKCNDDLLENYGFILEDNEDACVRVTTEQIVNSIPADDPNLERKLEILDMQQNGNKLKLLGDAVSEEMLFASKVVAYSPGLSVEEGVIKRVEWTLRFSHEMLAKYPTKTEDEKLIASPSFQKISKRARMAILLRKEEREILEQTIKSHEEVLANIKANGLVNPLEDEKGSAPTGTEKKEKEEL